MLIQEKYIVDEFDSTKLSKLIRMFEGWKVFGAENMNYRFKFSPKL